MDDGDGVKDNDDPQCMTAEDNYEENDGQCGDGLDNDGDGWIDMADPACSDPSDLERLPTTHLPCNNGEDDDADGVARSGRE